MNQDDEQEYSFYDIKYGIEDDKINDEDPAAVKDGGTRSGGGTRPGGGQGDGGSHMELYDWVQCIVSAILCGILIFVFIGRIMGVDGSSMVPTLHNNDKFVTSNLFYTPHYGDIVVIKTVAFGNTPIVKRVIATEGQTVDIDFTRGEVFVNGSVLKENYINEPTMTAEDFKGPVTVPKGCVFVMGDNRNASTDSRSNYVGMVDKRQILGKVLIVLIPGDNSSGKDFWSRIGSVYK